MQNVLQLKRLVRTEHKTRKEPELTCVPQLFPGWLLGTRRFAIGQLFPLSPVTLSEVLAKVNSAQVPYSF